MIRNGRVLRFCPDRLGPSITKAEPRTAPLGKLSLIRSKTKAAPIATPLSVHTPALVEEGAMPLDLQQGFALRGGLCRVVDG